MLVRNFQLAAIAAAAALFSTVTAQLSVNIVPCSTWWPSVTPGQRGTIDRKCAIYPGYPTFVGSVNVTFALDVSFAKNMPSLFNNLEQYAQDVWAGLAASIPEYQSYQDNVADVVVILYEASEHNGLKAGDAVRPEKSTGPCQIRLFSGWLDPSDAAIDDAGRKQAIAHEMYHCVQETMFEQDPDGAWWVEATASYFATAVYPTVSYNKKAMDDYQPTTPLWAYAMRQGYAAQIFFQSMTAKYGAAGVNNWVRNSWPFTDGSAADERTRLSTYANFADDFYGFAKQFSMGAIYDTNNSPINIAHPVQPYGVLLSSDGPLSDATVGTLNLDFSTGTVNVFSLPLASGQTVSLAYTTQQANVRLAYSTSLGAGAAWTDMPQDNQASGSQGTVVAQCNTADPTSEGSITVYILATSTDDVDRASADIVVTQQTVDNTCQCKEGGSSPGGGNRRRIKKRGLDLCLGAAISATIGSVITSTTSSDSESSTTSSSSYTTTTSFSTNITSSTPILTSASSASITSSASSTSTSSTPATGCALNTAFPTVDSCLTSSKWALDDAAILSVITDKLGAAAGEAPLNSVNITGSGVLSIEPSGNSTFTYNGFTIDLDLTVEGIEDPTQTVVDGTFEANLYMTGDNEFCLLVYSGEGTAVESDPLSGGFSFDLSPEGGWVEASMRVQYTCSGGDLTMQGTLNGVQDWGPYVYHAE